MPPSTAGAAPAAAAGAAKGSMANTLIAGVALAGLPAGLGQGMLIDRYKEEILELIEMYGPFFMFFWNMPETLGETLLDFGGFI